MKRILYSLLALWLVLSCEETRLPSLVEWCPSIDESALGDVPRPDSYKITVSNIGTEAVEEMVFDALSPQTFNLVQGIYNITVQAHGTMGGRAFNYIGTANAVKISPYETGPALIKVSASESSALVFKEIHYNASMVKNSASARYLKDTYFEVYNNSDQTVYADGICLGDVLSHKVYDFSDKLPNASDYVFMGTYVWQIPGSGTDYPIAPGESFIIAASAIDHSQTAETLDLSTAEFETICDRYKERGGQPDANAVNMALVCTIKERDVLDAIDLLKSENPDDKRLESELDAGWIKCATTGGNQSVVRKISGKRENGSIILQDTNNTTEDFTVSDSPQIRRDGAKRPGWSNWTTAQ